MLPFISSHTYTVAGLTFQTWGTFIALAFVVATWIAYRRAQQKNLDANHILELAFWIFLASFIGSRLLHVLVYEPHYYLAHPWEAIDPRKPGFAIFGGFIGAAIAFFIYARRHALKWIEYADVLIWGLPWGCGIGRIGCFLIHDHPGTLTHSLLGVQYPDGSVRHDLGLYLSLIGFATGGVFLYLNHKQRAPGFWLGAYMVIEGLVRFSLDFLRIVDARYLGLTPTQYLSIPLILVGGWLLRRSAK
jgi:phosphatidylglycerol:prolipoprotein diacylglycerol transferase